jgi:hypothetical protein
MKWAIVRSRRSLRARPAIAPHPFRRFRACNAFKCKPTLIRQRAAALMRRPLTPVPFNFLRHGKPAVAANNVAATQFLLASPAFS